MKGFIRWAGVLALAAPLPAQLGGGYGGPSILGRGGTLTRSAGEGNLINLRPFLGVQGTYTKGLTAAGVDSGGNVPERASYGVTGIFGATGDHTWRRSALSMSYSGRYRHYAGLQSQDGIDQSLILGFAHQLTRRISISLTEAAGTYSRGMGLGGLGGMAGFQSSSLLSTDPTLDLAPSEDLLDTRTYYLSSGADLTFRKSARTSFNMGATGFVTRRRAAGLAGVQGVAARGDVSYMLARNHVIGLDYMFMQFNFTRSFGSSTVHGLAINYSTRIARRWNFGLRGGVFRLEAQRIGRVSLDPVVAAILGQRFSEEIRHGVNYGTMMDASLVRSFRRSNVSIVYMRGVVPGNGVYLTSVRDNVSGTIGYTGLRRVFFSVGGGYSRMSGRMQTINTYSGVFGMTSAGVRIARSLHFNSTYSIRQYQSGTTFNRTSYTATAGLAFSPGPIPLSFW